LLLRAVQACGNVEPVIGRRGVGDFEDVDAVVADKNGPLHSALAFPANRAPGRRLTFWRWLGGGFRFLNFAFERADLGLEPPFLGLQFFDAVA
jgi:hypothetical protein